MKELINQIKKKKELADISAEIVEDVLKKYLEKNNLTIPKNKKQKKVIIKEIRAELRKYVGRFQIKFSKKKRLELLRENNLESLLKTHS